MNIQKGFISLKLLYEGDEYEVGIYPGSVSIPEYYLSRNFYFTEQEREELLQSTKSLTQTCYSFCTKFVGYFG